MKMAKSLRAVLLLTSCLTMVGCGGTSESDSTNKETGAPAPTPTSESEVVDNSVAGIIAQAEKMDAKDLYKKALDELDGHTMSTVGNSSRGKTGAQYFLAYLRGNKIVTADDGTTSEVADETIRKAFPDYKESFSGKIDWTQPKNNMIFDQIHNDVMASSHSLSMTLIQDGSQIQSRMIDTGELLKYVPKEWKGSDDNKEPLLALQSLNKVFEFNNLDTTKSYKNIWSFVAEGETPNFMGIDSEPVGRNFLVELTAPKYAAKMKEAYEAITDTALKAYVNAALAKIDAKSITSNYLLQGTDENLKYSLAFDSLWMKQYAEQTDDGPICTNLVKKSSAGQSGLLVYSKLRSVKETDETSKNNVTVAAYQDDYVGLGGFMYKHYMGVVKTTPYPWASCAFIHFLTTTEDGFRAWGKDIGGYASDENVRAKFDHSNDGGTDYTIINDKGYSWWNEKCVVEDPSYVSQNSLLAAWLRSERSAK